MGIYLANVVNVIVELYIMVILISVVLSYILPPYHRVREFFDRLVDPLLTPIRRAIPPIGMIDISPMILFLLVQLIGSMLAGILRNLP
jgi:YggT family protein